MADGTDNDQQATLDEELKAAFAAGDEVEEEKTESEESEVESKDLDSEEDANTSEEEGGESEEAEASESDDQEEESDAEEGESQEGTIEPPQDWSEEWAEKFRQLPDEGRQILLDAYKNQQADYTRKTQEVAEIRKAIPDETRQQLDLKGVSEGQYIRSLTAADNYLRNNPTEGIKWLMQQYGVTPEGLGVQEADDEDVDPAVSQLRQEIRDLKAERERERQSQQTQQQGELDKQVQQFATETDEKGHLKHPDFEKLKPAMAGLIQTGYATDLESAYEQAKWADPEVRERLLSEQQRQATEQSTQRKKEKAKQAKKAATPASSGSSKGATEEPQDLRTELEKQFDETQ